MQGQGTIENPYIITTPSELDSMRNNLTASYALGNDIDMSSWGNWNPISFYDNVTWKNGFTGNFDGKGYKIKNLTINKNDGGIYLGLFGQFFNGVLQNVGLENVNINNGGSGNNRYTGSLVGYTYNATIKNCYVTGGSIKTQEESGGLIGKALQCNIENCYSNINITLPTTYYGGGFAGTIDSNTTVRKCYSAGRVTYTQSSSWNNSSGFVGFVRNNTDVFFYDCFWDTQTSGQVNPPKIGSPPSTSITSVLGKTTSEMKTQSTYSNWDFTSSWTIQNDYPTLRIFGVRVVAKIETITVYSFSNSINSKANKTQKSNKQLQSFTDTIQTNLNRYTATIRTVSTYSSIIESNAQKQTRTVRSGNRDVQSFICSIGSSIYKESKTIKQLLANIKPLLSNTVVLYPLNTITPNAYLTKLENNSRAFKMDNTSTVSYIVNPSNVEVRE